MADRVKYFLLGVLFLVVAGVIAYDRWNSAGEPREVAKGHDADTGSDIVLSVDPSKAEPPVKRIPDEKPQTEPEVVPPTDKPKPDPVLVNPTPPEPKPAPAPDKTHIIKKGETLEAIAIKYYGTRDGIQWIVDANKLGNANRVFANQKLIIPARKETARATSKEGASGGTAVTEKTSSKIPSRYKVKEGDGDLYAICRRFYGSEGEGARVHHVMDLNSLWSADVKPGTVLILPPR